MALEEVQIAQHFLHGFLHAKLVPMAPLFYALKTPTKHDSSKAQPI
jgi:hypothetical protein